ncbi:MAG: chemotaxis protein CheW [Gammaproteobacteria bacterium]|nr:chemotaxis protein CheW [Gammaproteobacteria bacterium]
MLQKTDRSETLSDSIFKFKKGSSQTGYLGFQLSGTCYAINIQHVINIIEHPSLIYLSHMSPPVVAMQHHGENFIPILDFAGYRLNTNIDQNNYPKVLVLSENCFRKDKPFGLLVDNILDIVYFKQKDLIKNNHPFDNLLPAYYYAISKHSSNNVLVYLLDINDLANQID